MNHDFGYSCYSTLELAYWNAHSGIAINRTQRKLESLAMYFLCSSVHSSTKTVLHELKLTTAVHAPGSIDSAPSSTELAQVLT